MSLGLYAMVIVSNFVLNKLVDEKEVPGVFVDFLSAIFHSRFDYGSMLDLYKNSPAVG